MSSNRKRRDGPGETESPQAKPPGAAGVWRKGSVIGLGLVALSLVLLSNRPPNQAINFPKPPSGTNASAGNSTIISNAPASGSNGVAAAADAQLSDTEKAAQLSNRGTELFQQGKIEAAAHDFAQAVELAPEDETAHFNLGAALARLGKFEEAKTHYEEAIRIFPDYTEAQNNLGNLLAGHGELSEAIQHLKAALKLSPDNASAHNNLGTALVKQGKLNEAVVHFSEAARLMPGYAEARCNLGNAYLSQGRTDEAIAEFNAALHGNPDFEPALRGLAKARQKRAPTSLPPGTPTNPANASQ